MKHHFAYVRLPESIVPLEQSVSVTVMVQPDIKTNIAASHLMASLI